MSRSANIWRTPMDVERRTEHKSKFQVEGKLSAYNMFMGGRAMKDHDLALNCRQFVDDSKTKASDGKVQLEVPS